MERTPSIRLIFTATVSFSLLDAQNNLQGAATYDGTHYWFEFRKALNSGDGFDWTLSAEHTYGWQNDTSIYGGYFTVGLWQGSKSLIYIAYLTLDLSSTPVPEFNSIGIVVFFGLAVCVCVLRRSRRGLSRRTCPKELASNGFERRILRRISLLRS